MQGTVAEGWFLEALRTRYFETPNKRHTVPGTAPKSFTEIVSEVAEVERCDITCCMLL